MDDLPLTMSAEPGGLRAANTAALFTWF